MGEGETVLRLPLDDADRPHLARRENRVGRTAEGGVGHFTAHLDPGRLAGQDGGSGGQAANQAAGYQQPAGRFVSVWSSSFVFREGEQAPKAPRSRIAGDAWPTGLV